MFYDNYVRLCNSVNKSPSAVALEIGISKPTVSRWKNGSKPNRATLLKIADYFSVNVECLTGDNEAQKEKPAEKFSGPAKYELLNDHDKALVDEMIERLYNSQSANQ